MPKIIFQPLMITNPRDISGIANPRDTWRGTFLLDNMVIARLPGIANPRNAWRGTLWGKWQAMLIIQFKVQISKFKVKRRIILLRLRCPRSCRNWWSC